MGFLKGGAVGATIVGLGFMMLAAWLNRCGRPMHMSLAGGMILYLIIGGLVGGGIGGMIGAVRRAAAPPLLAVRRRHHVPDAPEADPRPRLAISALYALTAASVGTLLAASLFGRGEVTRLVGGLVPYEVTSLQARLMLSGTLFLCAYAVIAGLTVRTGPPGTREQSVIAAAGFLTGILGLPSLAVVLS